MSFCIYGGNEQSSFKYVSELLRQRNNRHKHLSEKAQGIVEVTLQIIKQQVENY